MIDSMTFSDLMRLDLIGTTLGSILQNEYPLCWLLPMGATADETTNQGKTNTARILAGALVPGIQVIQATRSPSAPAQRAVASSLEEKGSAIYDEFAVPSSQEHFLNAQGLQALATGGRVTPGRALENSPGFKLKHPLFLVAKICTATPDIRNRSFSIFLDQLNETNKSTEEVLNMIMSGQAALLLRLCALHYMAHFQLVEKAKLLQISGTGNRFNGHMAIAEMFGSREAIQRYFVAANKQAEKQHNNAEESGLADDLGMVPTFELDYFFQDCSDLTLGQIVESCKTQPVLASEFVRLIIQDQAKRLFNQVLQQHRIRERAAMMAAHKQLGAAKLRRIGWELTFIPKGSPLCDKKGNPKAYIILKRAPSSGPDVVAGDPAAGCGQ